MISQREQSKKYIDEYLKDSLNVNENNTFFGDGNNTNIKNIVNNSNSNNMSQVKLEENINDRIYSSNNNSNNFVEKIQIKKNNILNNLDVREYAFETDHEGKSNFY